MTPETIAENLGVQTPPEHRADGDWVEVPDLDVRAMTRLMVGEEHRLVTFTVVPHDGRLRFIYHWDLDGVLLNISTWTAGSAIASIADICPAADWAEREARDFFGVEFLGRAETPPLMLRDVDEPGFFMRTAGMCREVDPSDTDWAKPGDTHESADADRARPGEAPPVETHAAAAREEEPPPEGRDEGASS